MPIITQIFFYYCYFSAQAKGVLEVSAVVSGQSWKIMAGGPENVEFPSEDGKFPWGIQDFWVVLSLFEQLALLSDSRARLWRSEIPQQGYFGADTKLTKRWIIKKTKYIIKAARPIRVHAD